MMPSGSFLNVPPHILQAARRNMMGIPDQFLFPDEIENFDKEQIFKLVEKYFDDTYPVFEPEIVYRMDSGERKDYYLPALKVLKLCNDRFFSPQYEVEWKDLECYATCCNEMAVLNHEAHYHESPYENCDCGIYGSVNLEEIGEYLGIEPVMKTMYDVPSIMVMDDVDTIYGLADALRSHRPLPVRLVLCVIEPFPDAKVIMCRKGWKASHAFISEIVGETISMEQTSQLLSIAWQRDVDLRRIRNESR